MRSIADRIAAALVLAGCSLVNKAEPLDITYYEPAPPAARPERTAPPGQPVELRLDRVVSAEHLASRIAYRENGVQIGFYEEQRWAERPEAYLRRALSRALYSDRGLVQAVSGARPALEAELLAFEEVRDRRSVRARVSIQFVLRDGPRVIASDIVTIERPVSDQTGAALAHALGAGLEAAASEVGARTVKALRDRAVEAAPEGTPARSNARAF